MNTTACPTTKCLFNFCHYYSGFLISHWSLEQVETLWKPMAYKQWSVVPLGKFHACGSTHKSTQFHTDPDINAAVKDALFFKTDLINTDRKSLDPTKLQYQVWFINDYLLVLVFTDHTMASFWSLIHKRSDHTCRNIHRSSSSQSLPHNSTMVNLSVCLVFTSQMWPCYSTLHLDWFSVDVLYVSSSHPWCLPIE